VTRLGSRGALYRLEPDEGNSHVRFSGGINSSNCRGLRFPHFAIKYPLLTCLFRLQDCQFAGCLNYHFSKVSRIFGRTGFDTYRASEMLI
jgi:hypothetical protein